jgi:hypothetical protein
MVLSNEGRELLEEILHPQPRPPPHNIFNELQSRELRGSRGVYTVYRNLVWFSRLLHNARVLQLALLRARRDMNWAEWTTLNMTELYDVVVPYVRMLMQNRDTPVNEATTRIIRIQRVPALQHITRMIHDHGGIIDINHYDPFGNLEQRTGLDYLTRFRRARDGLLSYIPPPQ